MRCHRKQDTGYKIQDVRCKIPDLLSYDKMMYLVDKIIDLGDKIMDPWMRDHGSLHPNPVICDLASSGIRRDGAKERVQA